MIELKAKKFVKLGTAVRYLGDVKFKMGGGDQAPEPFGADHVVDNMRHVIELTRELKLDGTLDSGSFGKLEVLYAEFQKASQTATVLNMEQAEQLHEIARRVREALMSEGNNTLAYYLDDSEVAALANPGWPPKVTLELIGRMPWGVAKWLVGLFIAAFGLGVGLSEAGVYDTVKDVVETFLPGGNDPVENSAAPRTD